MTERKSRNLIQKYLDITQKYSDAPEIFLEAGAYHIISTLLGRFFFLKDIKIRRPNTWFIISSIPGRMRRSSALDYANNVIYSALMEYYYRQDASIDINDGLSKFRLSDIEEGSPEGIVDRIQEGIEEGVNSYHITSSEFGGVLQKIAGKGYEKGVDSLLSKLYYGESFNQSLSRRGGGRSRDIPKGMYVTMYSAMQEPSLYLSESMSRQGLLRRIKIMWVKPEDIDMKNWKSPFEKGYDDIWDELKEYAVNDIVPLMQEYYSKDNLKEIRFTPEVKEKVEGEARRIDEELLNDPSDLNLYMQTQWEYQVKVSVLEAIAEGDKNIDYATYRHLDTANSFLKKANRNTPDMMKTLAMIHKEKHTEDKLERVRRKITRAGAEGIRYSDILTSFRGMTTLELQRNYISTLLGQGKIFIMEPPDDKPGRTGERYADMIYY